MGTEVLVPWLAGQLLNVAWDKAKQASTQPSILVCFEKACGNAARKFPDLLPSSYAWNALAGDPDGGEDLATVLTDRLETRSFPTAQELTTILMKSWQARKAMSSSADVPLFQQSAQDIEPFIRCLSKYFFRELTNEDRLRNEFIVSVLQDLSHAPLRIRTQLKPSLSVWAVNGTGMNVVTGVHNREPNSEFRCSIAFQLLPGDAAIDLVQFDGTYWAYGCRCLNGEPSLTIDGSRIVFLRDSRTLQRPLRIAAAGVSLSYSRPLHPPLLQDAPVDCDNGDIDVLVSYRANDAPELVTQTHIFRFAPGGALESVPAVRPVPRLTDDELRRCLELKAIDEATFQRLLAVSPTKRYLGARSTVGQNYVESSTDLSLLRRLYHQGC